MSVGYMPQPINPYAEAKAGLQNAQAQAALAQAQASMQGTQSTENTSTTSSPTFLDEGRALNLVDLISGGAQTGLNNLTNLGDFTKSSTFQNSLQGILEGMRPQIDKGYQDLSDAARIAGGSSGLRSGAYGTSVGQYAAGVGRNQMELAAKLVGELMPSYVSANQTAVGEVAPILGAMKGETTTTTGSTTTGPAEATKKTTMGGWSPWGNLTWLNG